MYMSEGGREGRPDSRADRDRQRTMEDPNNDTPVAVEC